MFSGFRCELGASQIYLSGLALKTALTPVQHLQLPKHVKLSYVHLYRLATTDFRQTKWQRDSAVVASIVESMKR